MPKPCEKGVGAEADAVAGILAGSTENIRGAVATLLRRAIILNTTLRCLGDSLYGYLFSFEIKLGESYNEKHSIQGRSYSDNYSF